MELGLSLWNDIESGYFFNQSNLVVHLFFHLKVRASHLMLAPYNEYQQFLYETITDFREKGWNFQQIADWLNENGYTTVRGKKFRNAHAHSILKKKRIRDVRITKRYKPELSNFYIQYMDRTLVNQL